MSIRFQCPSCDSIITAQDMAKAKADWLAIFNP
jgi:hypothetical protein